MRRRMLGSVFGIGDFYADSHSLMCIPLQQVPPAPGHGQPEGHQGDIPLPVGPGRAHDAPRIDMASLDTVGHRLQPFAVSNLHVTATEPPYH